MESEIDRAVRNFFSSDLYKNMIIQHIENQLFLSRNNFQLKNLISDELSKVLPWKVRNECNSIVKGLVTQELELFSRVHIPSHVNKAMSDQLGSYLNNHVQMIQILQEHSKNLNQALRLSAEDTLRRVVNEEQYHQVTNLHVKAMNQRFSDELTRQDGVFQSKMNDFHKEVLSEIQELREANGKIEKLQKEIKTLTTSNKMLKGAVVIIGIISLGGLIISVEIRNKLRPV